MTNIYLPDTIPILNPKKNPTAAPPSPAEMSQSVVLSVQIQADCWTTLEEERLSVMREAAELVVSGVSDPEEITSCNTGTSSSLTDSIAGTFHLSFFVTLSYSQGFVAKYECRCHGDVMYREKFSCVSIFPL